MSNVFPIQSSSVRTPPSLLAFAETWFEDASVAWRSTTTGGVQSILARHLLPVLRGVPLESFTRAEVLAFRSRLAREPKADGAKRSNARVNLILQTLGRIFAERERQLGIPNPCLDVRRLPTRRTAIQPFTLPELHRLAAAAPEHLKEYVWIRGLIGMRSGEANGLRWDCVDLVAGTIEIRQARVCGSDALPKNEYSERTIALIPAAREALVRQHARRGSPDGYVFLTPRGYPLDTRNFARRDWVRVLASAGLKARAPEQLRHTAATLLLAAGEAPTYVARILGHADCRMLLTTYARFMPGALGRTDGLALQRAIDAASTPVT